MVNITKLSSSNYLTWSIQIRSLFKRYVLVKFIDETTTPPPPTTTVNGLAVPNDAYTNWSLIEAIETPLQPLIASSKTTREAWINLASMYDKPTHGHIKQLQDQLKLCVKGRKDIDGYMQLIKTKSDALALLSSPVNSEYLTDIILDGLTDDYKSIIKSVHSRDSPISFSELHKKLLNREIAIAGTQ
ncbi:hypothetical protein EUTSA_v10011941mg [Eutrema salsugineum]|uniref:Retrotransposon Copia-like N-terminal domain-containing protein n=1 Tax=Eutrema salsugineum TaxID=72664 RepID=V4JZN1_EUTSA|nr:hypothetical protein EUTSA_v10011941mg [Eutrema salsugineum]